MMKECMTANVIYFIANLSVINFSNPALMPIFLSILEHMSVLRGVTP